MNGSAKNVICGFIANSLHLFKLADKFSYFSFPISRLSSPLSLEGEGQGEGD